MIAKTPTQSIPTTNPNFVDLFPRLQVFSAPKPNNRFKQFIAKRRKALNIKLTNISPLKQPSAWLPFAMSLAALALVLGHAAIFGIVHEADEGAAAHVWQILMAGQIPFVVYFMFRWLPQRPKESLWVLALLAGTWLANFAAVYWLT